MILIIFKIFNIFYSLSNYFILIIFKRNLYKLLCSKIFIKTLHDREIISFYLVLILGQTALTQS